MKKYSYVHQFKQYRNREDVTNLPPGILVYPSKNVIFNIADQVEVRKGYTAVSTLTGTTFKFGEVNLSFGLNTYRVRRNSTTDTLEVWYNGEFRVIYTFPSQATDYAFTRWTDFTATVTKLLVVPKDKVVLTWTPAIATVASSTATTITIAESETVGTRLFPATGSITIGGVVYTYTGISGQQFTGVSPSAASLTAGSIITIPAVASAFTPPNSADLAATSKENRVIYATKNRSVFYASKVDDFTNVSLTVTNPNGGTGAGTAFTATLPAPINAFVNQENDVYISCLTDKWFKYSVELSQETNSETRLLDELKSSNGQAAISQQAIAKAKNDIYFWSFEPTIDSLGRVQQIVTPQTSNLSDSIKNDLDSYDNTDASLYYFQNSLYVSVPADNIWQIYNFSIGSWTPPQTGTFLGFFAHDNILYAYDYDSADVYRMFYGDSDNGDDIEAHAVFSYVNGDMRANYKKCSEIYVEGYIQQNTTAKLGWKFDFNNSPIYKQILGTDKRIVYKSKNSFSLGKQSLGKFSLAGEEETETESPFYKFRAFAGAANKDHYEMQLSFYSKGQAQRWKIMAIGNDDQLSLNKNTQNVI